MSKGGRSSSASGYLEVRSSASLPVVSVDGLADEKVNPDARLLLSGTVRSLFPDSLRTTWLQTAGPPINLTDPTVRIGNEGGRLRRCFSHSYNLMGDSPLHNAKSAAAMRNE